jgi:protein-S-isoprenylcysteine O-methyltransferase Ste14
VLVDLVLAAVVALFALPALVLGVRGLLRRQNGLSSDPSDRTSLVVAVVLRVLALVLLLGAAGLTLLSTIGAAIKDVDLHGFVYVFFVLTALLALLVLTTFGRRDPRRARRPATPARR